MYPSRPEPVRTAGWGVGRTLADLRDSPVGCGNAGWHAVDMNTNSQVLGFIPKDGLSGAAVRALADAK
jgi:hypothetical protein